MSQIVTRKRADRSVLIVDDEPHILDALEDLLEDEFNVLTASRGEDALELLQRHDCCVVISDQRMPDLTGDRLLSHVRDRCEAVRVLITGYTDMKALVRAVNEGQIYAYVSKPWKAENLKLLISKAADHYELLRHCQAQKELLDRLMEQSPDGIYFKDLDGRFIRANHAFTTAVGLGESIRLEGRDEAELGAEGVEARSLEDLDVIAGRERMVDSVERFEHQDGTVSWLSKTKLPLADLGMVAIIRDITHRKEAERQLRYHAAQQHAMTELTWDALAASKLEEVFERALETVVKTLEVDGCGHFVPLDDGSMRLVMSNGFPDQEGDSVKSDFLDQVLRSREMLVTRDLDQEGMAPLSSWARKLGARRAAATPVMGADDKVWGLLKIISSSPLDFVEQDLRFLSTVASLLSLSVRKRQAELELKESQRRLLQSQKLEAVGQMAGGIAHDFNNILAIIKGNAELLPSSEEVEQIADAAGKASALIGQLMSFARNQPIDPRVIELNEVVAADGRMLQRLLVAGVELSVKLASSPVSVKIDPSQLTQVLANLVVNARDAIEGEGRIEIEVFQSPDRAGMVGIRVQDTGAGMSEVVIEKIFEPFFTTKPPGKGTGLGLATAYGIVAQAGGILEVESQPGKGTTFTILLPREEPAEPVGEAQVDRAIGDTRNPILSILVVDDETSLVRLVCRFLTRQGHQVASACSPQEALKVAAELDTLDLLVTDLVLPGIRGTELAKKVRESYPDLKVILMSGYSESPMVPEDAHFHFLSKPFNSAILQKVIEEALDD